MHNRGAQYLSNVLQKNIVRIIIFKSINIDVVLLIQALTELDISRNQIGYQGMFHLSNALKENKVKIIFLFSNVILMIDILCRH